MNELGRWLRAEWDRAAGVALVVLGVVFVAVGYNGVSGSPYVAEELAYLASGAVGGLFLLGCGAALWLSADLHDEWRKLDRIEAAIRGEHAPASEDDESHAADDDHDDGASNGGVAETNGKSKSAQIRVGRTQRQRQTARLATALQPEAAPLGEGSVNLGLLAALTAALIVIVVGWNRAAGTGNAKTAFSGLAISLAGVVAASAVVAAYTFWLRRSVANRQVELLGPYLVADAAAHPPLAAAIQMAEGGEPDERVLVGAGLTHFHRPGCPATIGVKTSLTARNRVRAGLT